MTTNSKTSGYAKNLNAMKALELMKLSKEIDLIVGQNMEKSILTYIGCSGWTNASRSHAVHIADKKTRKPLCGKEYKGGALDVSYGDISEITCNTCLRKLVQLQL